VRDLLAPHEQQRHRPFDVDVIRLAGLRLEAREEAVGNVAVRARALGRVALEEGMQRAKGAEVRVQVGPGHALAKQYGARGRQVRVVRACVRASAATEGGSRGKGKG
jgi:hypothetical protein